MCSTLDQMSDSYLCQPITKWYSLMWYPSIPTCGGWPKTIIFMARRSKTLFQLKHVLRKTQGFFEEAQNFAAAAPGAQVDSETGEEERIRLLNRANGIIWKVFLIRIHHLWFLNVLFVQKSGHENKRFILILVSCFRVHSFWLFEKWQNLVRRW